MCFSVLMSVYSGDDPSHLSYALDSIWDTQGVKPSEIVLVVDGPVSITIEDVLTRWGEKVGKVLVLVRLPKNQGLGAALAQGLCRCKNELIARMDADDIALSYRFEKQVQFLSANPDVDILGGAIQEISYDGRELGQRILPSEHESIIDNLWACPIVHPSVMFRRSQILKSGNYSQSLPRRQDYELWFRCAEAGLRFHNIRDILIKYRFGEHTHRKQSIKKAFQQGIIGFKGGKKVNIGLGYRLLCFVPFFRSLLPTQLQHLFYRASSRFDPRKRAG